MAQSESAGAHQSMEPATDISVGNRGTSRNLNINAVAGTPDQPTHDASSEGSGSHGSGVAYSHPPAYFEEALEDAERLLKYAAEIGIDVDAETQDHILQARAASGSEWNQETTTNLLSALTQLAAQLKPVTAESLKASSNDTRHTIRLYWWVAICLAIVIVPFSIVSFVTSAVATAVRTDIATANDLAVKLRAQLGPPPVGVQATPAPLPAGLNQIDVITELQLYASTIRSIDARARQLNFLVLHAERDPFGSYRNNPEAIHAKFQLPVGLPDLSAAAEDRTQVYQDVRYFAQSLLDDVSFFYGAITACLLPVLYALLGTCAYLLRNFEKQMALRTFTPSAANSARFLIAAIGGAVVGLFNNFTITEGASIPPLAIAFLVGYAVDVFFAFLEGLLQTFTKNTTNSAAPVPASGG
jgi:hypothetical protein